jgi:hypothetical protein
MTFNEIYKTLIFEKTKLITTKLLCPRNNLVIVISSVKQCEDQIYIIYNKSIIINIINLKTVPYFFGSSLQ